MSGLSGADGNVVTQCEEKSQGKKILSSQKFYSESVLKFP